MSLTAHLPGLQHIQGIAIDAARSNVDHHYLYICDAYNSFMQTHTAQVACLDWQHTLNCSRMQLLS